MSHSDCPHDHTKCAYSVYCERYSKKAGKVNRWIECVEYYMAEVVDRRTIDLLRANDALCTECEAIFYSKHRVPEACIRCVKKNKPELIRLEERIRETGVLCELNPDDWWEVYCSDSRKLDS